MLIVLFGFCLMFIIIFDILCLWSIHKLRIHELRIVDSEFQGSSLWPWEFPSLRFKNLLEANPLKFRFLVRELSVGAPPEVVAGAGSAAQQVYYVPLTFHPLVFATA